MSPLLLAALLGAAPVCSDAASCQPEVRAAHVVTNGATGAPDPLGRGHWLVDEENDEVLRVRAGGPVERFAVGRWPEQLAVTREGMVIVTCRQDGQLAIIGVDGGVKHIAAGAEPRALALDETARRLFVGLVTAREVVAFDLDSFEPVARAPLDFEPGSLALAADVLAVAGSKSAELVMLEPATLHERWRVVVPSSAKNRTARIDALAALGADLFVAARMIDSGIEKPSTTSEGGGYGGASVTQPFDVQLFVLRSAGAVYAVPRTLGSTALPEVTAMSAAGSRVMLASRGARRLTSFDGTHPRVVFDLPSEVWAPSVVALSIDDRGAIAFLDANRREAAVGAQWGKTARRVTIPPSRLDPELRRGRELFYAMGDRRLSTRSMSCASCHPDGREDGVVWRLQGTSRQTPMLTANRLRETAPFNWLGTAPTLEANLKQTIEQRLMGQGLNTGELTALSRWVREGLRRVGRAPAEQPARVARGRELFVDSSVGCATCHPPELGFTDGVSHDVESLAATELASVPRVLKRRDGTSVRNPELLGGAYDTPSLLGLALTAPYFHDGSARTLADVIDHNADRMGTTSHLSAEDRAALVAYLESL